MGKRKRGKETAPGVTVLPDGARAQAPSLWAEAPGFWAGAALAACVVFLCLTKIRDADVWWHLKTGELIWHSGIPYADPFSHAIGGKPWVSFEWLCQALFYALFHVGGARALTGFKALLAAGAFLLLWRAHPGRPFASAGAVLLAALGSRHYLVERPFLFDYLFLAAVVSSAWRLDWRRPPRSLWFLLPAMAVLWSNLHGGAAVLLPLSLMGGALAERAFDREVPLGRWALLSALSAGGMLLNPHGAVVFGHLMGTLAFPAKELITEWHAPTWEFRGIYGATLFLAAAAAWRLGTRRPSASLWALALAAASLQMKRNIPLFLIAAAPLLAAAAPAWAPAALRGARSRLAPLAVAAAMAACVFLHTLYLGESMLPFLGVGTQLPLSGAAAFLQREGVSGKMFNEYQDGGQLIWLAGPGRKVFADGRSLEYGPEFVRRAVRWYLPEVWAGLEAEYGFDYAVLSRHGGGAYPSRVLDEDPSWRPVYWDDAAMVYVKTSGADASLALTKGYRLLQPGRGNQLYVEELLGDELKAATLLGELKRSIREAPENVNALLLLSYVRARTKNMAGAEEAARGAVRAQPGRAQPRHTLGWVLSARGDLDGAEAAYRGALSRLRRSERRGLGADILNNLGRIEERRGDMASARRCYERAVSYNPSQGDALHNLKRLGK